MLLNDVENLSEKASRAYEIAMEKLLSHRGCPQCMASAAAAKLKDMLMEEKKDSYRGKLVACRSILQIPHRCGGKGVHADGFRYRKRRNRKPKAHIQGGQ